MFVLEVTAPCEELRNYLKSSPKSLNWLAQEGRTLMLNLALSLDSTFGPTLMSMFLRQ